MAGELADLFIDKELAKRVTARIANVIAQSFVEDKSRQTLSEAKRRFDIVIRLYRDLRALGWAYPRILDELPVALRSKLDGGKWEPDVRRSSWAGSSSGV